jgi:hypothetical protein
LTSRSKARGRYVTITDELVELFRRAQPLWNKTFGGAGTEEERAEARAAIEAFETATGRTPWEHSLLSPRRDTDPIRIALLARVSKAEAAAWKAYAHKWWRGWAAEVRD